MTVLWRRPISVHLRGVASCHGVGGQDSGEIRFEVFQFNHVECTEVCRSDQRLTVEQDSNVVGIVLLPELKHYLGSHTWPNGLLSMMLSGRSIGDSHGRSARDQVEEPYYHHGQSCSVSLVPVS